MSNYVTVIIKSNHTIWNAQLLGTALDFLSVFRGEIVLVDESAKFVQHLSISWQNSIDSVHQVLRVLLVGGNRANLLPSLGGRQVQIDRECRDGNRIRTGIEGLLAVSQINTYDTHGPAIFEGINLGRVRLQP